MLLNAEKFQGYSSFGLWFIKGKQTGGLLPLHPLKLEIMSEVLMSLRNLNSIFVFLVNFTGAN